MMRVQRRAYNRDGSMIEPARLSQLRRDGIRCVEATCSECQHSAVVNVDHLPDEVPVPDVPLVMRLKCSRCGARADHIDARANWIEQKHGPGGRPIREP